MNKIKTVKCHPDRPYYSKGLCASCYVMSIRAKPKNRDRFNKQRRKHYRENKIKINAKRKKLYMLRDKERHKYLNRKSQLKRKYGITLEQYDFLLKTQKGKCAICKGINSNGLPLFVDHDHETGKIRGLLCSKCNTALAALGDNLKSLLKVIRYLE